MSDQSTECKNCNKAFDVSFKFCPHCGQKAKDDLTLGVLFYNTISNYFSFDARFFKSFIPLMVRPGYVAKQFVNGRRLQYLHPAQYYLFVSVLFFFLYSFKVREYNTTVDTALQKGFKKELLTDSSALRKLDTTALKEVSNQLKKNQVITGMSDEELVELDSIMKNGIKDDEDANLTFSYDKEKVDSLIQIGAPEPQIYKAMGMDDDAGFFTRRLYKQMLKFHMNSGKGIVQAFFDSIPIALFILLPIFALILKLFYWRRGRFAHHLVFSFYYFSFLFVLLCLSIGINYFVEIPAWIDGLLFLFTIVYLWLALKHFYEQGYFLSLIKTGMVSFVYMLFIIPIAIFVLLMGSFLMY